MNRFVVFPNAPWDNYRFKKLLHILSLSGEVYFITNHKQAVSEPVLPLSLEELNQLRFPDIIAVVSHPYWIHVIPHYSPKGIIALQPETMNGQEVPLLKKFWDRLASLSSLVCTESEKMYLEQAFRRSGVLLASGEDPSPYDVINGEKDDVFLLDFEYLFKQAVEHLIQGESPDRIERQQRTARTDYYANLIRQMGPHEMLNFLVSVYAYLQEQPEARIYLLQAFEQLALQGVSDALQSHYRFLSAIEAKFGDLEKAAAIYGVTAVTAEEKKNYEKIILLLKQGQEPLAKALLYRLNDDYKSSNDMLMTLSSPAARRLLFQNYLHTGGMLQALQLIHRSDVHSVNDLRDYYLLQGTARLLEGERHLAIRSFLKAASYDYDSIAHLTELQVLDEAVERMARGQFDEI